MQETCGKKPLSDQEKPFSESCERNKIPILERLREIFTQPARILEIGSGTGQHAVHFGAALPHLTWQTSDLPANHPGIQAWLDEADLANVLSPIALDVNGPWPDEPFDGVFTANTLHIVSWEEGQKLLAGASRALRGGGQAVIYGPFNYGGAFTSDSNARFDQWLKNRDPGSGIRDFAAVSKCLEINSLRIEADHAMPANNRCLVFVKT
jgi:SAM-dependent methyltransferase